MSDMEIYWKKISEGYGIKNFPFTALPLKHQQLLIYAVNIQITVLNDVKNFQDNQGVNQ